MINPVRNQQINLKILVSLKSIHIFGLILSLKMSRYFFWV